MDTKPFKDEPEKDDWLCSIIYSSGTSGNEPKGIICNSKNWREDHFGKPKWIYPYCVMSYTSLSHGMDRGMVWQAISMGGRITLSSEETVLKDVKFIEPILFLAMPPIWNKLYYEYTTLLEKMNEKEALKEISNSFGKNLIQVSTGGASISNEVFQFMNECFKGCAVTNEYGTTECPGISSNGIIRDGVEVKLVDVKELGYTINDNPNPRGEIWVKSRTMAHGYYKFKNENDYFKDGYFITGDIGEIENGLLKIIDRKKDILELYIDGQSFWLPIQPLEIIFSKSKLIKDIVIHCPRLSSELLAIVVPINKEVKIEDLMKDFNEIGKKESLKIYQIPNKFIIENLEWNIENGFKTHSGKVKRALVVKKYMTEIDMKFHN